MKLKILFLSFFHLLSFLNTINCFYKNNQPCLTNVNCRLPNCHCDSDVISIDIKNKYRIDQLPQLVVLTIDDHELDYKSYQVYKRLLENFRNPNGCPIKATFFISDTNNKTSYCLIRNLYENGHEIAQSTLSYECPHSFCNSIPTFEPWDFKYWTKQVLSMKNKLQNFAAIPVSKLNGFRAPLLEPSANVHYRVIASHNFLYDASLLLNSKRIVWPYTLDYNMNSSLCNNGPTESFRGLWEIPSHINYDSEGNTCLKFWEGHCKITTDNSAHGVSKFLRQNFLRSYYENRAPYVINLISDWLKFNIESKDTNRLNPVNKSRKKRAIANKRFYRNLEGVLKFVNETLKHNRDVYFVSAYQALKWTQNLEYLSVNFQNYTNITEYLHKVILDDVSDDYGENINFNCPKVKYDGRCDYLKLKSLDYNNTGSDDSLVDEDEETSGVKDLKTLLEIQSEFLFLNDVVTYLGMILVASLIAIFIYDKIY